MLAIQNSSTLEELEQLVIGIVKSGIKGEHYTKLIMQRDRRATALKEGK
jgi:hypothetical protein